MVFCSGTTKNNTPCKAHAAKGSAYCFRHAPAEETPESPRAVVDEPEVSTETEAPTESPELIANGLYATPIADPRPSPPTNARKTEPGKAQPYAEIKNLLKAHKEHRPRNAFGINGSAKDLVRIDQEKGSSLKTPGGWLGALIKKNKSMPVLITCCAVGCTAEAKVGAHVWLTKNGVADLTTAYIVPACKDHNSKKFDYGTHTPFTAAASTVPVTPPPNRARNTAPNRCAAPVRAKINPASVNRGNAGNEGLTVIW